jgi:hypothetical protein
MLKLAHAAIIACIVLAGCASSNVNSGGEKTLKITGFRQGLVNFDSKDEPQIYKVGSSFPYQVNGTCVAAGKGVPCMWHGFEFSFEAPSEDSELNCISEASRKRDEVNPSTVVESGVTSARWGFALTGQSGHYVRPQYTFGIGDRPFQDATTCTFNGKEVLKFDFTITP